MRSSCMPCANWHLSPYLHSPASSNGRHSSVLYLEVLTCCGNGSDCVRSNFRWPPPPPPPAPLLATPPPDDEVTKAATAAAATLLLLPATALAFPPFDCTSAALAAVDIRNSSINDSIVAAAVAEEAVAEAPTGCDVVRVRALCSSSCLALACCCCGCCCWCW